MKNLALKCQTTTKKTCSEVYPNVHRNLSNHSCDIKLLPTHSSKAETPLKIVFLQFTGETRIVRNIINIQGSGLSCTSGLLGLLLDFQQTIVALLFKRESYNSLKFIFKATAQSYKRRVSEIFSGMYLYYSKYDIIPNLTLAFSNSTA